MWCPPSSFSVWCKQSGACLARKPTQARPGPAAACGRSDPPSRELILEALKAHDVNGDKKLDQEEFHNFVKDLLASGGDKFFKRFGATGTKEAMVVPAATPVIKQLVPGLAAVPDALVSPFVSQLSGIVMGTK